ncbi:UPF0149 family protein [Hahella aquimaris]|uniref:UPF0149 family protein n=1 Tax=Hahella sp. HNIBRBA332 TaxID=3015983 RepID=UPI00352E8FA3
MNNRLLKGSSGMGVEFPSVYPRGQVASGYESDPRFIDLRAFLCDAERCEDLLNYNQCHGFLFGLACCPVEIDEQDWLPVALGECYQEELCRSDSTVIEDMKALYQEIRGQIETGAPTLPSDCLFSWDTEERRSFENWCEGVILADEWLAPNWVRALEMLAQRDPGGYEKMSRDLDDTISILKVFQDVDAALEILERESASQQDDFREELRGAHEDLNGYLMRYAKAGRGLSVYFQHHDPLVREEPKVGRNDPCPCGSGKKFKKCCL